MIVICCKWWWVGETIGHVLLEWIEPTKEEVLGTRDDPWGIYRITTEKVEGELRGDILVSDAGEGGVEGETGETLVLNAGEGELEGERGLVLV